MRRHHLVSFVFCALLAHGSGAARSEFSFERALPAEKTPIDVSVRRNPFHGGAEPEKPLPIARDRNDPAAKLPELLSGRIKSVIRKPRVLLLLQDQVVQPGDEVRLGSDAVVIKHRVVLRQIDDERLIFHLTSLDPQHPGQLEASIDLPAAMKKL